MSMKWSLVSLLHCISHNEKKNKKQIPNKTKVALQPMQAFCLLQLWSCQQIIMLLKKVIGHCTITELPIHISLGYVDRCYTPCLQ